MPGAFDSFRQFALVFCTGASLAASANFAIFMDKTAQQVVIFIIDYDAFVGAKLASPRPVKALLPAAEIASGSLLLCIFFSHNDTP